MKLIITAWQIKMLLPFSQGIKTQNCVAPDITLFNRIAEFRKTGFLHRKLHSDFKFWSPNVNCLFKHKIKIQSAEETFFRQSCNREPKKEWVYNRKGFNQLSVRPNFNSFAAITIYVAFINFLSFLNHHIASTFYIREDL